MAITPDKQHVLIAGGTSGMGKALASILINESFRVTVTGRSPEKIAAVEKELPGVRAVRLDATDRPALDDFFKKEGKFDHLVLAVSAGKGGGLFSTLSLTELRTGFDQKFWPQLNTMQAALPYMQKEGSITFITAISSTSGLPGTSGLAAINGALELMVPTLAKELKPLRINAVSPGVIDTPWWDFLPADAKEKTFADYSASIAVGRVGRPEEVASLLHEIIRNGYLNGVVIGCHGGLS